MFQHLAVMGSRSFWGQTCAVKKVLLDWGSSTAGDEREPGSSPPQAPAPTPRPPQISSPLQTCSGERLSLGAAPILLSCPAPASRPFPAPEIWRVYCCDLSSAEVRMNPETQIGPHALDSVSLPAATQTWLLQEKKGFQVVQAQLLKTRSRPSNPLLYY